MLNRFLFLIFAFSLAGCALTAQQERQAKISATTEEAKSDFAYCSVGFSEADHDAIARAKCLNAADEKLRTVVAYPDLINLRIAKRAELAERQSTGKITRAQAVLEFAQTNTQIETEFQRRATADRSVRAQETAAGAAVAATLPTTCTRIGNSVTCF
jgi:hypothetical protein